MSPPQFLSSSLTVLVTPALPGPFHSSSFLHFKVAARCTNSGTDRPGKNQHSRFHRLSFSPLGVCRLVLARFVSPASLRPPTPPHHSIPPSVLAGVRHLRLQQHRLRQVLGSPGDQVQNERPGRELQPEVEHRQHSDHGGHRGGPGGVTPSWLDPIWTLNLELLFHRLSIVSLLSWPKA